MRTSGFKSDKQVERDIGGGAPYTIGRLAKAAGLPISTIRYYERQSLLKAAGRTGSAYRLFSEEAVKRLRFIRLAQVAGFSLGDIAVLLEIGEGSPNVCVEVSDLLQARMRDMDARIKELTQSRKALRSFWKQCVHVQPAENCPVIVRLRSGSAGSRASQKKNLKNSS